MPDYAIKDARSGLISCAFLQVDTDAAKDGLETAFRCMDPERTVDCCPMAWQGDRCPCKDEIIG